MAEEHAESPFAILWWALGILALLILLWLMRHDPKTTYVGGLFTGPTATSTSYIPSVPGLQPGTGADAGFAPSSYYPTAPQFARYPKSPWYGSVMIEEYVGAEQSDPSQEYLVLFASSVNSGPVAISGWHLISTKTGKSATLGGGVTIPKLGTAMTTGVVELLPGQSAVVATGRSPIGVSFRENECSGYLNQFQNFTPPLPLSCPFPSEEIAQSASLASDDACVAAVESYAPCQALTSAPQGVSAACSAFMNERLTYNGCVTAHARDANFAGSEWRLYLGQPQELWGNSSDSIALLDGEGRLVAAVSY